VIVLFFGWRLGIILQHFCQEPHQNYELLNRQLIAWYYYVVIASFKGFHFLSGTFDLPGQLGDERLNKYVQ
jgi:hypothetical protein